MTTAILSIAVTDAPGPEDVQAIFRALDGDTAPICGPARADPLGVLLRDDTGTVVGGLWGVVTYSWLSIEMLFVPARWRGQGVGSRLVRAAEAAARARGCLGAKVNSFDFQAPEFYQRLGFTAYAVLVDDPPGHRRIGLFKRLSA